MPDRIDLSRRRVLGAMGLVGASAVIGGGATSTYFSDEESYPDNRLVAGELDLTVDWEEHYADWSADENDDRTDDFGGDESDTDTDGDGVDDFPVVMTGSDPDAVPADHTGFPTYEEPLIAVPDDFVDDFLDNTAVEAFPDDDGDGIQDLILTRDQISALYPTLSPEEVEAEFHAQFADVPDQLEAPVIDLTDVKPGDFGEVTFSFHLHNNPGYIWMQGELLEAAENGLTEPERKDPDEDGPEGSTVELLDEIKVAVWHDDGDNVFEPTELVSSPHDVSQGTSIELSAEEALIAAGTLREVLEQLSTGEGIPLDADPTTAERDCFPFSTTRYVGLAWWLPVDHANEIQTDEARFDLGFYTEQCRHNPGTTTLELPVEDVYIGYEDREGGDFDYNDFGMDATITETYEDESLVRARMSFDSRFHAAGDSHAVHIERTLPGDVSYDYTVTRSAPAAGAETPAGSYSGSGTLDLVLFDSDNFAQGTTVGLTLRVTGGSVGPPTSSPRWDDAADNALFGVYDPYLDDRTVGAERHIEDTQPATSPLPTPGDGYDVPYILVVPETDFVPPGEGTPIDDVYAEFDEYYRTGDPQYADWYDP